MHEKNYHNFTEESIPSTPVPTPTPPPLELPQYRIGINGTAYTFDGKDVTLECALYYSQTIGAASYEMGRTVSHGIILIIKIYYIHKDICFG